MISPGIFIFSYQMHLDKFCCFQKTPWKEGASFPVASVSLQLILVLTSLLQPWQLESRVELSVEVEINVVTKACQSPVCLYLSFKSLKDSEQLMPPREDKTLTTRSQKKEAGVSLAWSTKLGEQV